MEVQKQMGNLSQMVSGELKTKLYSDMVHPSISSMFCTDCMSLQIYFLRGPAFLTHCLAHAVDPPVQPYQESGRDQV